MLSTLALDDNSFLIAIKFAFGNVARITIIWIIFVSQDDEFFFLFLYLFWTGYAFFPLNEGIEGKV